MAIVAVEGDLNSAAEWDLTPNRRRSNRHPGD
jgi:hypothetical protein